MPGPGQSSCYQPQLASRVASAHIDGGHSFEEIAGWYDHHPCARTVRRMVDDVRAGRPAAKLGKKGRKQINKKFNAGAARYLNQIVTDNQQMYLAEIKVLMDRRYGVPWTLSHISKCLKQLGFVSNKVHSRAAEANPEDRAWFETFLRLSGAERRHFVFCDEVATVSMVGHCMEMSTPLATLPMRLSPSTLHTLGCQRWKPDTCMGEARPPLQVHLHICAWTQVQHCCGHHH
jgi:transposase